jgi:hypothetical protein
MLAEGFWTEVKIAGEHIQLFAEESPLGVQASVYNVNTKSWIAPSETVDDIDEAKERAVALASAYLKRVVNIDLRTVEWKRARSINDSDGR